MNYNTAYLETVNEGNGMTEEKAKFIRKDSLKNAVDGNESTCYIYEAFCAKDAREFLRSVDISDDNTTYICETPEGDWGINRHGLFLRSLSSASLELSAAECEGTATGKLPSKYFLSAAALGDRDNFVCDVKCGQCGHEWKDGLQYENATIVKCPSCGKNNKVDSDRFTVSFDDRDNATASAEKECDPDYKKAIAMIFALSGASALIYEVVWIRSLSLVLGSTTYAVSSMLSAFMAGLAIGSISGGWAADRIKNTILLFGILELGIGVFGALTIPAINALPPVYFQLYKTLKMTPNVFLAMQFFVCFLIMLVPTVLMGATFPVVAKTVSSGTRWFGSDVGKIYSLNTLGAIIGAASAGFILIPLFGIKGATHFAVVLNLITGLCALGLSRSAYSVLSGGAGITAIILAVFISHNSLKQEFNYNYYLSRRFYDYEQFRDEAASKTLLFKKEDAHGTVQVFHDKLTDGLVMRHGGKIEGSTEGDMENTLLLAYLPIATNPEAKNFLGIGLGTAITLRAALGEVKNVDWVEINPSVVDAVRSYFFPEIDDSGVNIIINDARNYLQLTEKKYDVISSEPSYPTESGVANLFTLEFFQLVSSRLNKNGVFCQWIPYYLFKDDQVASIIKTFSTAFPNATLWRVVLTNDLLIIGSPDPFRYDEVEIAEASQKMNVFSSDLHFVLSRSSNDIASDSLQMESIPVNTDDRPLVEFWAAKNMLLGKNAL